MKTSDFSRSAVGVCAVVAMLAGCGALRQAQDDTQSALNPSVLDASTSALGIATRHGFVFSFDRRDGAYPDAGLTDVNGTLFGTTYQGGSKRDGTVFSLTADGHQRVLYAFVGGPDGSHPNAGVTNLGGTLYGATNTGGTNVFGTIFSVTTDGTNAFSTVSKAAATALSPTG
ncbi:MAG: choice-of-anchor tandem repeat GloVer-containing protein [Candidatus Cybelea sp.]